MIVRFLDVGGLVDYHCSNLPFINNDPQNTSQIEQHEPH